MTLSNIGPTYIVNGAIMDGADDCVEVVQLTSVPEGSLRSMPFVDDGAKDPVLASNLCSTSSQVQVKEGQRMRVLVYVQKSSASWIYSDGK